jgi:hypothetical protein
MTDRPTDPRLDPRTAEPGSPDPDQPGYTDLGYVAEPAAAPGDDRPRVVRDDGQVDTADAYRDGSTDRPGPAAEVDDRPLRSDGRRPLSERGVEHRDEVVLADPARVREREEDAMGGIKWGSAFFGWLTAMGVAALLTALLAAAGTALALNNPQTTTAAADLATTDSGTASTIGLTGAVAVLVVLFLAYLAGGYVAGRMARIDGPRQGLGVWIWMVVLALVAGIVATVAGSTYDVLGRLNTFPRVPVDGGQLATAGLVTLGLALVVTLVGALLGGAAGMGYHRRMDAVGLGLLHPEEGVPRT